MSESSFYCTTESSCFISEITVHLDSPVSRFQQSSANAGETPHSCNRLRRTPESSGKSDTTLDGFGEMHHNTYMLQRTLTNSIKESHNSHKLRAGHIKLQQGTSKLHQPSAGLRELWPYSDMGRQIPLKPRQVTIDSDILQQALANSGRWRQTLKGCN